MNKNVILGIIVLIVVVIAAFFLFNPQDETQTESNVNTTNTSAPLDNDNTNTDAVTPSTNTNTSPDVEELEAGPITGEPVVPNNADIAVFEISYDGTTFSPSQLTIKNGDIVIFKNDSDKSFWPASGPHPDHTNYPEFDAKKSIGPGSEYQFKFAKTGEWSFHNHLDSSSSGKIVVK